MEQPQIDRCALAQLVKVPLGCIRVAVGFPAAAAGEVLAAVLDKAHHIVQRIAEKNADLVRKFCRAAQPPGQLGQQAVHIRHAGFGQAVALLPEKALHLFVPRTAHSLLSR